LGLFCPDAGASGEYWSLSTKRASEQALDARTSAGCSNWCWVLEIVLDAQAGDLVHRERVLDDAHTSSSWLFTGNVDVRAVEACMLL
jgi:hypothetical protein